MNFWVYIYVGSGDALLVEGKGVESKETLKVMEVTTCPLRPPSIILEVRLYVQSLFRSKLIFLYPTKIF